MWPEFITVFISLIGCCPSRVACSPRGFTCISESYVNGCNVLHLTPYKEAFAPACNRHDICYFCGQRYNWSRQRCDTKFLLDMTSICTVQKEWLGRVTCTFWAHTYHEMVRLFGGFYFDKVSPVWCEAGCALMKGEPSHKYEHTSNDIFERLRKAREACIKHRDRLTRERQTDMPPQRFQAAGSLV